MSAGPYQSEREAREAAALTATADVHSSETNHRLMLGAIEAAGVELGAYDRAIVQWLANWERVTCAVIAGLITRAREAANASAGHSAVLLAENDTRLILDALYVAADHKRDYAANCADCEARPEGLCPACESRLDTAAAYDALADRLRAVPSGRLDTMLQALRDAREYRTATLIACADCTATETASRGQKAECERHRADGDLLTRYDNLGSFLTGEATQ